MLKNIIKKFAYWVGIIIFSLIIGFSLQIALAAWNAPPSAPPAGNLPYPLNTSTNNQIKAGALGIGGLFQTDGNTYLATSTGNVGIGTTTPPEKLTLEGGNFLGTAKNPIHKSFFKNSYLNNPKQIYVSGKYAYVTTYFDTGAVEILDISNPSAVSHVGYISEDGKPERALFQANGIYVSGKYAYVTGFSDNGVEIIDISNPAAPAHVGAIFDNSPSCLAAPRGCALGGAYNIYVSGKYAYVTGYLDGVGGVEILDISNPAAPVHVGAIFDNAQTALLLPIDIYVSGKYAYVTSSEEGVEILDISNSSNPTHVGAIFDSYCDTVIVGGCPLEGASDIYVSGKYAYVTAVNDAGVEIIDISNPAAPAHAGAIFDNSPSCLAAPQGCALNGANGIYVSGKYAYVTANWEDGVEILDISNPFNPTHAGAIFDDGIYGSGVGLGEPRGIFVAGKYAYVAAYYDAGLEILDISGIDAPSASIGNISTSQISVSENIDIGNNLYIGNGLNVGLGGIMSNGVIQASSTEAVNSLILRGVGAPPAACNAGNEGIIYYKASQNIYCYCDGGSWQLLNSAGGSCP